MSIYRISRFALFALLASGSLSAAASQCKGLAENACMTDQACIWVQSYTRKDGRNVSGHCKVKRGKSALNLSESKPTR